MPDTASIIASAISAHSDSGSESMDSLGNETFNTETPDVTETPDAVVADGVVADTTVTPDDIDKILEAEGVKPPIQGQRENRIPYSHTKRIIQNAKKKWQSDSDAALATERQTFTTTKSKLDTWEAAEKLASTDPDKYIATLAQLNPAYKKFLQPLTDAVNAAKKDEKDDPEPQPEKQADGSFAWTPEAFKKHTDWVQRQAVKQATAEWEKKYGPILQKQQQRADAEEVYKQNLPIVQRQYKAVQDAYGAKLVSDNEGAIQKVMADAMAAGEPVSMAQAAAQVLIPLLRADETAIRAKVMKELKDRPAAARPINPGGSPKADNGSEVVTGDTQSVIRGALAEHRGH